MFKNIFKNLIYCLFLISVTFINSQELNITGSIKDSLSRQPISLVSVVLYQYKTNQIIAYTTSSNEGIFNLKSIAREGIYTLKTYHLGYQPVEKQIVLSESTNKLIKADFQLIPLINRLEEVVLKKAPPIIIKKDTIIYDVKHWTQKNDQTLEEVLAKIEGFKILSNGEIEINGKLIRKVLINNKEVANSGAAILTKSLDPNDVENIEVRLNEQDNKIKESLLDTKEYVILDIKLKKNVNTSLFGKIRLTTGYLEQLRLGGYTNLFSINKKVNFHLFAEHDNFGHQTISLDKIRNIGEEAFQKIFELPADFQSLIEREGYQSEIFGFNDYTLSNKSVVGITSKIDISEKWTLFIGSYNSLNITEQEKNITQNFEAISQDFKESKSIEIPISKNKVEFRFNASKTKFRFDTNFIYENPSYNTVSDFFDMKEKYVFNTQKNNTSFYNNLFYEQKISSKLGIEFKASHSMIETNDNIRLEHNNPNYFITENNSTDLYNFFQNIHSKANQSNLQISAQYTSKVGIIKIGNNFEHRILNYESTSELSQFSQAKNEYFFQRIQPFLNHTVNFGSISFINKIGYSFFEYSNLLMEKEKSAYQILCVTS